MRPPVGTVRHLATFGVFILVFCALEVFSFTRESATWDEPIHLAHGYQSLVHHDFRVDVEHPPLLRMWAALPLAFVDTVDRDAGIDETGSTRWITQRVFTYAHRFLYLDNDADRLLYRARLMIVLLGALLGGLVYAWSYELFGWPVAVSLLTLYAIEPNVASHARVATTDLGVACFMFGAVYCLWRTLQRASAIDTAGVVVFTALAVTAKFSALILAPMLVLLIAYGGWRGLLPWRRAVLLVALLAAAGFVAVWAVYAFRYLPSATADWRFAVHTELWAAGMFPRLTPVVAWIDRHHLLPNAYAEGLLFTIIKSQTRVGYLAGSVSEGGWWYYFPAAFLLKTPLTLIALSVVGLVFAVRSASSPTTAVCVLVPIAVHLGWSMTSHINIGLRHILPIYPFVLVVAGFSLTRLFELKRPLVMAAALALCVAEPASAYPHTLAFFNVLAGGPSHGSEYLVDSNVDWGQDLKSLRTWMTEHRVARINLAYFGMADPRYYGIDCAWLPGAPPWVEPALLSRPVLPGYVAVSATLLRGVFGDEQQRQYYRPLSALSPVATIGHSIFVYRLERPWWPPTSPTAPDRALP